MFNHLQYNRSSFIRHDWGIGVAVERFLFFFLPKITFNVGYDEKITDKTYLQNIADNRKTAFIVPGVLGADTSL
jgi:hypothetical protein